MRNCLLEGIQIASTDPGAGNDRAGQWDDGHWVVAIGYSPTGVFFEDPSLQAVRGFLSYRELLTRWHDTGPHRKHMPFYGLAVWHPRRGSSGYDLWAERIG